MTIIANHCKSLQIIANHCKSNGNQTNPGNQKISFFPLDRELRFLSFESGDKNASNFILYVFLGII
jgi:hypothetical protein